MEQAVRGYFRIRHAGKLYDVGYQRTQERHPACIPGSRLLTLNVLDDGETVMHYEDRLAGAPGIAAGQRAADADYSAGEMR